MDNKNKDTGFKGLIPADFIVKTHQENGTWSGQVQHAKSKQVCSFDNVLEMTLLIQEKLDQVGFPQAATERRCWTSGNPENQVQNVKSASRREKMGESKQKRMQGGPTFFIRINYQQNASWQGSVQWLEGKSTRFFRSHLELIMLMQEAVEKSGGTGSKIMFSSWEDAEEIVS